MKKFISSVLLVSMLALSGCSVFPAMSSSIQETSESTSVIESMNVTETSTAATSETPENTTSETGSETEKQSFKYNYGVFLSVTKNLESLSDYHIVVIDAQYYSKEEIEAFRNKGHQVYSYINIGSLENFRSYYKKFKKLKLGKYENWDEEIWIDVSNTSWQKFITEDIMPKLVGKGIDGFFVDNCDVYYNYPKAKIMNGLTVMMKALVGTGKKVLINGGDMYLDAYCKSGGSWNDVITGINQENVFAKIIWKKNKFGKASAEDHKYFVSYVERYSKLGAEIYLLEYTTDKKLISQIDDYCKTHGFEYYVSDSIELDLRNKNYV